MAKHDDVKVQLVGLDGNAFSILGRVTQALTRAGYGSEVDDYQREATDGDYYHLLRVTKAWVDCDALEPDDDFDDFDEDEEDDWYD